MDIEVYIAMQEYVAQHIVHQNLIYHNAVYLGNVMGNA